MGDRRSLVKFNVGAAENLGFHNGRPTAALVIFRSCLQWKTFQADRTVLFDKVSPRLSLFPRRTAAVSPGNFLDVSAHALLHEENFARHGQSTPCVDDENLHVAACAQIINAMGGQIERQQDNNACLSYWLSNTVTLLYLLQRNIKPASGGAYNARLRSPTSRSAPVPTSP